MVHDIPPTCKSYLAATVSESRSRIDDEYCMSVVKTVTQRIQAAMKVRSTSGGQFFIITKYFPQNLMVFFSSAVSKKTKQN